MKLIRDPESFIRPLDRAIDAAFQAVFAARTPVRGSENRVRVALDEKRDLERFIARITELLRTDGFPNLPKMRHGGRPLPHCHRLTVGPWRGVFLVDPGGELVVALLFSEAPHSLDDRLIELVRKYKPKDEG